MARDDSKGSFVKWQSVTIGQMTYAINLILGLSVAALGFQITLLIDPRFSPVGWKSCVALVAPIFLSLSVFFGIWVVLNRLMSFRATASAARKREERENGSNVESDRIRYGKLDARTWCLLWLQVGTFGIGILLTVLSVLAFALNKPICAP